MKSKKVCVNVIEVMKIMNKRIGVFVKRRGVEARRIIAIRFVWIPGMRPVNVPARIPRKNTKISVIIFSEDLKVIKVFLLDKGGEYGFRRINRKYPYGRF